MEVGGSNEGQYIETEMEKERVELGWEKRNRGRGPGGAWATWNLQLNSNNYTGVTLDCNNTE